jgi:diguanylate cyclase (GGDEF)-like protein
MTNMPARSIQWKLAAAFLAVAGFVATFVGIAIVIHLATVERAAQLEAGHVAELIADAATENGSFRPALQEYLARLNTLRERDVVIVDVAKKGLADADPGEVGKTFDHDPGNEVGKTIADGQIRTFIETSPQHPDGARQIVVPVGQRTADTGSATVGAVILEYTKIRQHLLAAERAELYRIVGVGILVVLLVTLFGLGVARRIAQPLRHLKDSAQRIAAQDFSARVAVSSHDEIGLLGSAFNQMAEDLSVSHAALVEHRRELEQRVAERTQDLIRSNTLLQLESAEHKLAAERVEYLAYYDSLTTLPNRGMFSILLNQAVLLAHRDGKQLAVLFVDLDRFKNINDTLGHDAGDLLLVEIGKRLKACLRDSDTVARLGGDEFVVLLPDQHDGAYAAVAAYKILIAAGKPFIVAGQELRLTASVGISVYPKDGVDEQSLMKNADIAMYQAKEEGKNNFQFYSAQMNVHSFERLALESSLRRAVERHEFELHYQPRMDAHGRGMTGIEALLRWRHPELGIVLPAKFIPVAEETGLIMPIGKWVLRAACMQNVAWQERGLPRLSMAVNLSGRQFSDEHLLHDLTSILKETGMSPELLELEITENLIMEDITQSISNLEAIRAMGIHVAIDDFGTGFSSLSQLSRLPVDILKLDRSIVTEMTAAPEGLTLVSTFIKLAHSLKIKVVAEGVETEEQSRLLRLLNCDEMQGYLFSEAVPDEIFESKYLVQILAAA